MGLSGVEPLTSRLSGVRSNHLSYRPSPPPHPSPLHDSTTPRRKSDPSRLVVKRSVATSCNGPHSQSRRGPGPFFGRNSSSSSSSNSSSRSSYSSRSSRSSSSSSSSSKSPNCSSPRLSPRRLSDQSDVSRDNIVTPS